MQMALLSICGLGLLLNILTLSSRGFLRGLLRFLTMLVAALCAFGVSKVLGPVFLQESLAELEDYAVQSFPALSAVVEDPIFGEVMAKITQMMLLPIIFYVLYLIFKPISSIIYRILARIVAPKDPEKKPNFWGGLAMAVVTSVLGAVMFVTPVLGYVDTFNQFIDATDSHAVGNNSATEIQVFQETYLDPLMETPVLSSLYDAFGEPLFDSLTTVTWEDEKTTLKGEMVSVASILGDLKTFSAKQPVEYDRTQSAAAKDIVDNIENAPILRSLFAKVVNEAALSWRNQGDYAGVVKPNAGENGTPLLHAFLDVFTTTNAGNLCADLDTFADILTLAVDHNMMGMIAGGSSADFAEVIQSTGFLVDAKAILNRNARMKPVTQALTDVGMRLLMKELGVPETYRDEHYRLLDDMGAALRDATTSEGELDKAELTETLGGILRSHGIQIEAAAVKLVAESFSDHFTPEELHNLNNDQIIDALIERFNAVEVVRPSTQP